MSKYITVQCPRCGAPATFDYDGIDTGDAMVLIGEDARCCRRCGTLFVEKEPEEEDANCYNCGECEGCEELMNSEDEDERPD